VIAAGARRALKKTVRVVVASQTLGIFVTLLRWRIRHPRVLGSVERKPATVELAAVL
jgi:hypothetical protein